MLGERAGKSGILERFGDPREKNADVVLDKHCALFMLRGGPERDNEHASNTDIMMRRRAAAGAYKGRSPLEQAETNTQLRTKLNINDHTLRSTSHSSPQISDVSFRSLGASPATSLHSGFLEPSFNTSHKICISRTNSSEQA